MHQNLKYIRKIYYEKTTQECLPLLRKKNLSLQKRENNTWPTLAQIKAAWASNVSLAN
jgi:hypothetical protein